MRQFISLPQSGAHTVDDADLAADRAAHLERRLREAEDQIAGAEHRVVLAETQEKKQKGLLEQATVRGARQDDAVHAAEERATVAEKQLANLQLHKESSLAQQTAAHAAQLKRIRVLVKSWEPKSQGDGREPYYWNRETGQSMTNGAYKRELRLAAGAKK